MAYLSGTIHNVTTLDKAQELTNRVNNCGGDRAVIREDSDGTYTVFFLSPAPIQPGQVEFIE